MDPNAAYDHLHDVIAKADTGQYDNDSQALEEMLLAIDAMDQWLSKGGFLPEAWAHARPMTERPS